MTASWGLGEPSFRDGDAQPGSRKGDLAEEKRIGAKERMTVAVPGGTRRQTVPRLLRGREPRTGPKLRSSRDSRSSSEEEMGRPIDIEAAFAEDLLYLLQSRPITTLGELDKSISSAA